MMVEKNAVILENGIEYVEIDDLVCDGIRYVLLSNINKVKDSCIRKVVKENNEEFLCRLDDDDEFDKILDMFLEKNKTLLN